MYPGMIAWWKHARRHEGWGAAAGCGPAAEAPGPEEWFASGSFEDGFDGGSFGVRRPLRFLAHKLGLSEPQVDEMAKILNDLKTERAQAAVDGRRSAAAFADAVAGESFAESVAGEAASARVKSAERVNAAVTRALSRMHAALQPDQRVRLAYLLRTGSLII